MISHSLCRYFQWDRIFRIIIRMSFIYSGHSRSVIYEAMSITITTALGNETIWKAAADA